MGKLVNDGHKPSILSIAVPTIGVLLLRTISSVLMIKLAVPMGASPIAIVAAGQRLVLIWSSLFLGLGAATTALVSRAWGLEMRLVQCAIRASWSRLDSAVLF